MIARRLPADAPPTPATASLERMLARRRAPERLTATAAARAPLSAGPAHPRLRVRGTAAARLLATALALLLGAGLARAQLSELKLSLEEAVRLALEHDLDLEIERINPPIAADAIDQARSEFHPFMDYSLSYSRQNRFLNNVLELAAIEGVVRETRVSPEGALKGKLTSGTGYSLAASLNTIRSDNPLRLFDVSWVPSVSLGFTQPLLRDFGRSVNLVRVRQAVQLERQAELQLKAKMLEVIRETETKYWLLAYAQQHEEISAGNLKVAEDLIRRVTRMRDAGMATDLDVSKALLAAEERKADLARARADLKIAQLRLRSGLDPGLPVTTAVVALETPRDEGPPEGLQAMLDRALDARPEIEWQEAVIENLVLEEKAARSGSRWKLDATGSTSYSSLGGEDENPRLDDPLFLTIFPGGLPDVLEEHDDPYSSFKDGNHSWTLGLSLEIPLGSRVSLAQLVPTRLRRTQEELRLERVRQEVRVQLETSFHNMDAEWSRLNSAREAVRLAQLQLNAEERNLEVGLNTVWDVIEAQDRLAEALDAEGKSMALYATARSRLQADQARSFEMHNLVVEP